MRKTFIFIFGLILSSESFSQTTITGKVVDANSGEALIGATVIYGKGKGTATDYDGNYSFVIQEGKRSIKVSYVGYKEINQLVVIEGKTQVLDFKLKTVLLNEVQVVSDIAIDRETPVAFSTIPMKKISEELASQDIPMVLNSTPGVELSTIGMSCEANSSLICFIGIVEKATGVSLSIAISATTCTSFKRTVFNLKSNT